MIFKSPQGAQAMTPTQANCRLVYWLQSNPPPVMATIRRSADFDDARAWWKEWAQQVGMFNAEYGSHLAHAMPFDVKPDECGWVVQEAVEQTDVFCSLAEAAEQTRNEPTQARLEAAE